MNRGTDPTEYAGKTVVKCRNGDSWAGYYVEGGGRRNDKLIVKWTATKSHMKLPDGSKRVLYKNPKYPGESRIRRMKKGPDGKMKASYVKPPGRMMGGKS